MRSFFAALFPLVALHCWQIDLKDPTYVHGILYTHAGGVIKNEEIRIQARNMEYTKKEENGEQIHKVEASGDLLIQYKGRIYVGKSLSYDFISKTGTIIEGKTFNLWWYIGGDKIFLKPDGSYKATGVSITTCENVDSTWDLHAHKIEGIRGELLSAKKVKFRLFQIPTFWLPSFKVNLKKFKEPIFRYYANWDRGQGPKAGLRYRLYSWRDFALYGRFEYRLKTGFGGALETEYFPDHRRTTFVTRNYLGTDRLETAPDKEQRYRVQGALYNVFEDGKTKIALTWDKYSDVRMPGDFKSDDFEVNTAMRTMGYAHHRENVLSSYLKVRPRLNPFESIKQDLPTLFASITPTPLGPSGFLLEHWSKVSYLNFAYSKELAQYLPGFRSLRAELRDTLYRPLHLKAITITPYVGGIGIFYSASPHGGRMRGLGALSYGGKAHLQAERTFSRYRHFIQPYLEYIGLSRPTVEPDHHYIFSIQDGYDKINEIHMGVKNLLFSRRRQGKEPSFTADLFGNLFFKEAVIPQLMPRLYCNLDWDLALLKLTSQNIWNFRNQTFDRSNLRCLWTFNENFALSVEGRYRSSFDWRKGDHDNFILDVTRPQSELLLSSLSDKRFTLLTHFFARPSPFWEIHFQSHHGFLRAGEWPYNEFKVDLATWISSAWKLRVTFTRVDKDIRFATHLDLVRK